MSLNITGAGATTVSSCGAIFIQVNAALTGTIVVTAGGVVQGTITNPTGGNFFRYGNLNGLTPITINPSTATDISVTLASRLTV